MNGFGPPEGDYDCCPNCTFGYTCESCRKPQVRLVPMEDVDLSKHGDDIIKLFLQIATSDDLSQHQKDVMLGAMLGKMK